MNDTDPYEITAYKDAKRCQVCERLSVNGRYKVQAQIDRMLDDHIDSVIQVLQVVKTDVTDQFN